MVLEYFSFEEHPESLAIGVFLILFAVTSYIMGKALGHKGSAVTIALVISLATAWQLYRERFYGWEGTLAFVIYVAVFAILLKILFMFFRRRAY